MTRHILVTNHYILGNTIGSLMLFERFGVPVARVTRGEFKFSGSAQLIAIWMFA